MGHSGTAIAGAGACLGSRAARGSLVSFCCHSDTACAGSDSSGGFTHPSVTSIAAAGE